jgi:hypothetical protein
MERSAFAVKMRFQKETAGLRLERPMIDAGRTDGVSVALEFLPAPALLVIADDQVA